MSRQENRRKNNIIRINQRICDARQHKRHHPFPLKQAALTA